MTATVYPFPYRVRPVAAARCECRCSCHTTCHHPCTFQPSEDSDECAFCATACDPEADR